MQISVDTVVSIPCTRTEADRAMALEDPFGAFESPPVLSAAETASGWELQLYCSGAPDPQLLLQLRQLAPSAMAEPRVEALPETDWVTLSQAGLEPIDIGRIHLHTGDWRNSARPGQWPIRIDAGLAFGTGQHATTAGCLRTASEVAKRLSKHNILDVGTGAGVLAIAARKLFPKARITASDIDPIAVRVAVQNAGLNAAPVGHGRGAIAFLTAAGVQHPVIARRAPYDFIFANILAGPLRALAPSLSSMLGRGGHLLLAGLLRPQAQCLIATYRHHGLRLVRQSRHPEWPTLLLQKMS